MQRLFLQTIFVLPIACALSLAQSHSYSGELKGTISDPSGAVVPGANIIATNLQTGLARTSLSGERGEYCILLLAPGTYAIRVELKGFVAQQHSGVQVTVGQTASVDFRLQVGASDLTIQVTGETATVETERAQQSNVSGKRGTSTAGRSTAVGCAHES